jgi:hypothetical protein
VLKLVGLWLRAGVLTELGFKRSVAGTPQGGVLTPPTQLAIRLCFALRVGVGGALGGAVNRPESDGGSDSPKG